MPTFSAAVFGVIVCLGTVAPVEAPRPDGRDYVALGLEVAGWVRSNFYDKQAATRWYNKYDRYGSGAMNRSEFARRTNEVLAKLQASQTAYYIPTDVWYYRLAAVFDRQAKDSDAQYESIGADFTEVSDRWFVRRVFAGTSADLAGLLRGDEIVAVNGRPFHPILSFRSRQGGEVELTIRRKEREPIKRVPVVPQRVHPRHEWLKAQEKGTRVVEAEGRKVLVIPYFAGAGDEFREAIAKTFEKPELEFEAVVLDCRDGLGGTAPEFLNLFNKQVPVLELGVGEGSKFYQVRTANWPGPLVLVINSGTRSGKEMLAASIKRHGRGVLVGDKTAGAVLAATRFVLSDGSLLYLAVSDVRVDGERLEGVGVEPDVPIADRLPYAAGSDPQLEKAIELAAEAAASDAEE